MSGPHLESVAPGVHAWIGVGGDSNAGAVETPHGLIVIDAQQNQALGEAFRDTLKARIGAPIRAVVNTHYHLDHVAGNVAFNGVPIISHDKTLAALEREVGSFTAGGAPITEILAKIRMFFGANFAELVPDDARAWFVECVGGASPVVILPPTDTFADQLHIRVPGDILQMEYWGPAHCDGDLAIWLQKSGVMFLGDLFFYGRVPWFGDCDLDGWIRTLDRVLQMDVKTTIPGHGPPATLKEVAQFRDLLAAVRGAVDRALKDGSSEDAAVREVALPQYAAMPRYKEWMPFNVRAAYRYLCGFQPP